MLAGKGVFYVFVGSLSKRGRLILKFSCNLHLISVTNREFLIC